jgi:hypothetical protein
MPGECDAVKTMYRNVNHAFNNDTGGAPVKS